MPASLHLRLQNLPKEKIVALRQHFREAPKALRLLEFLIAEKCENINTRQAVLHVYGKKAVEKKYAVCENRYYKLRKKIYDSLHAGDEPRISALTAEEKSLMEAKTLVANGRFAEAEKLLIALERECRNRNIFEILPETIDLLIQARQSLNKLEDSKELHRKFTEAVALYADLMEAKNLTRQVYEVNFNHGIKAAEPLFRRMAKLDHKHKNYPRFKLIYNFVAGYYKVGAGGSEYLDKSNVTNRHIGVAKKIMQQHPEMPAVHYAANGQMTQRYRLMELQAMCYYNSMHFPEAAYEMMGLYASVMQPQSPMNRMKNEILFTNAIHMLVAAERFKEALQVAQAYLKFLIENKRHEQTGNAYAEIANIHVSMFPEKSGYDAEWLLKRVDGYQAIRKKENAVYFKRAILLMKVKMLTTCGRFNEAERLLKSAQIKDSGEDQLQSASLLRFLGLKRIGSQGSSDRDIGLLKTHSRRMKLKAVTPGEFLFWRWLEKASSL